MPASAPPKKPMIGNAAARVFDRDILKTRQTRIVATLHNHGFLIQRVHTQLDERLKDITRIFKSGVHFGQTPFVPQDTDKIEALFNSGKDFIADEEIPPLKTQTLDLIMHTLCLHTTNDLPGALIQMRRALKPDGLFLGAMFGGETLHELRDCMTRAELEIKGGISPRVFPFADKQQAGALLQRAGFALPVVDSDIITVTYKDVYALMRDLRGMGESNIIAARDKRYAGKALFERAGEIYRDTYPDKQEQNGRIVASFEIIYMIGWAPHETQQKPLKPGSAQTRLADALQTEEHSTRERSSINAPSFLR